MRSGGHRDRADLFRVEPARGGLGADEADGALAVLPGALVNREPLGAGCPVHQRNALAAEFGETLAPLPQ